MPLIHVRSLPFESSIDVPAVIRAVSGKFAEKIGVTEEHVTVTWEYLPPGR